MTSNHPMRELRTFWTRSRERVAREPTVGMAILGGSWWPWALHRLRGVGLVRLGAAALHVIEALIVLNYAVGDDAIDAFALANIAAVIAGGWWGATEVLRERLRSERAPERADALCVPWLAWGMRLGLLALALAALVAIVGANVTHSPLPVAWATLAFVRTGVDLPIRVWHSRIYAYRRIYRSPWAQLAVESLGPILAVTLADPLGPWGVFAALVLSSAASRALTLHYISRALAQDGLRRLPLRLMLPHKRLHIPATTPAPAGRIVAFAVAGISNRIPNIIVFFVLLTSQAPLNISIGLHLGVGILSLATAWPWTHYHDLIPLDASILARFRRHMERRLMQESLVVGLVAAAIAIGVFALLTPTDLLFIPDPDVILLRPPAQPHPWPWALGPGSLALGLSTIAAAHIIAWRRGRTVVLAAGTVIILAIAAIAPRIALQAYPVGRFEIVMPPIRLIAEHAIIAGAMMLVAIATFRLCRDARRPRRVGRIDWMEAIADSRTDPTPWVRVELVRGGGLGEAIATRIVEGATAWARHHRELLITGLPLEAIETRAISSGWATSVTPVAAAAASPRRREPDWLEVQLDSIGRMTRVGPLPTPRQRKDAWRTLLLWVRHGSRTRDAGVADWDLVDGELSRIAIRLRKPSAPTHDPADPAA